MVVEVTNKSYSRPKPANKKVANSDTEKGFPGAARVSARSFAF